MDAEAEAEADATSWMINAGIIGTRIAGLGLGRGEGKYENGAQTFHAVHHQVRFATQSTIYFAIVQRH
jgi:hypothetical protein